MEEKINDDQIQNVVKKGKPFIPPRIGGKMTMMLSLASLFNQPASRFDTGGNGVGIISSNDPAFSKRVKRNRRRNKIAKLSRRRNRER